MPGWLSSSATEEGRGAIVDNAYEDVLFRNSDASGRDFFVQRLDQGFSRQRLSATFFASGEYYDGRGGGTDETWLDALYLDAFGRVADESGKGYFLDQLDRGRTRGSVASFFLLGAEGRTTLVEMLYTDLLRRTGNPDDVQFYAELLRTGSSVERIIAIFVSSGEYRNKAVADLGDEEIIVLTASNTLVFTSTGDVEVTDRTVPILGLAEGESLLGIDVRPSNGVLYGVTGGARS